jgi:hypothetical protein
MTKNSTSRNWTGWTEQQCALLGVSWPLEKGWLQKQLGRIIPDDVARKFEALGALKRAQNQGADKQTQLRLIVENDHDWYR